jgi:hypothetical protein
VTRGLTLPVAGIALAVMLAAPAAAQTGDGRVQLKPAEVPNTVAAQVECGTDPDDVLRRPFAGGFIFAWKCASNHANWVQALVYADNADGAGARLLRFPRPGGAEAAEELANIRWYPAAREVTELFVDPEDDKVCRTEGRWRLAGTPPMPQLVFWRETRDCEGKSEWKTVVGPRS